MSADQKFNDIILTLPHSSIAAISWGPKDGKPILAIHGWLDNAASFVPLIPYLAGYRVVAIDLPGHGLSSHIPPGEYFHFTSYIADIVNILDYLGWEQTSLLGHSLGAGISTIVAGVIPERITALALLDGIGSITVPPSALPDVMRTSITEYNHLNNKKLTNYKNPEEAINARLKANKMSYQAAELLVKRGLMETNNGFSWRTDPRLLLQPLFMPTEEQVIPFLERITATTCLIRPNVCGWPLDEHTMHNRIDLVKNITVHGVTGEHHVHMDSPEIIGPILNEFFTKIKI